MSTSASTTAGADAAELGAISSPKYASNSLSRSSAVLGSFLTRSAFAPPPPPRRLPPRVRTGPALVCAFGAFLNTERVYEMCGRLKVDECTHGFAPFFDVFRAGTSDATRSCRGGFEILFTRLVGSFAACFAGLALSNEISIG